MDRQPHRAVAGVLTVRTISGTFVADPVDGRTVSFGRNSEEVDVCAGGDDERVSRRQGLLVRRRGTWWLSNTGKSVIELPHAQWLRPRDEAVPLQAGDTTLFVIGTAGRRHVLELHISGTDGAPSARHRAATQQGPTWALSPQERLVLAALGQRHLANEPDPQPLGRLQVAELLNDVEQTDTWNAKRVERVVKKVRDRLAARGVPRLQSDEVEEPIGNVLSNNLLKELVRTMSLVPEDLDLLELPD